jgi:hypothetical protein
LIRQAIPLQSAVVRGNGPKTLWRRIMPVDTPTLFSQVIQDHLALKERNSELDHELPLDRYKN